MALVRRRTLGGLLAAGLLLGTTLSPAAVAALPPSGSYLQIVAHQDDDLLFMSPDLKDTINAGRPTTTVYLTAGEEDRPPTDVQRTDLTRDDCVHDAGNDPNHPDQKLDREDYAGCRALGAMAAWAGMAGAANPDDPDLWDRESVNIGFDGGSRWVEEDTLKSSNNKIHLVFLNLPEAGDHQEDVRPGDSRDGLNLTYMLNNGATRRTVLSSGSMVELRQDYDVVAVRGVLRGLIDRYNPTVIRTQDPAADPRYRSVINGGQWDPGSNDNHDHDATAQIVGGLVRDIPASDRLLQLVDYRCYNIEDSQVNLDLSQRNDKTAIFARYAAYDANTIGNPDYAQWTQRTYSRYWAGTNWAGRNADGRFQVVAALNGQVFTWAQRPGDNKWVGPDPLAAGDITRVLPGMSIVNDLDGSLQVFAVDANSGDIITTWQNGPDSGWSNRWVSLGNPNAGTPQAANVSYPAVARNYDGRLVVFVKNGNGGVSAKTQILGTKDQFEGTWADLQGGGGVQDGLSAISDTDGRIELFAYNIVNGVGKLSIWYQHDRNGGFTFNQSLPALEPASPPTVGINQDGRLDVFYRRANNSDTQPVGSNVAHTYQLPNANGDWTTQPDDILGQGGFGPVAVGSAPGSGNPDSRIFVFERNRGGGVSGTKQVAPNDAYNRQWTDYGNFISTQPAALADVRNGERMTVFAQADDGSMTMRQQSAAGGAAPFGDWVTLDG